MPTPTLRDNTVKRDWMIYGRDYLNRKIFSVVSLLAMQVVLDTSEFKARMVETTWRVHDTKTTPKRRRLM